MKVYPETKKYKKHDLCVISIENQFLVSFSLYPALYYATPRHNPPSDFFFQMVLNRAQGLKEKSHEVLARKNNNRLRYNKKCRGADSPPPPGSFRVNLPKIHEKPPFTLPLSAFKCPRKIGNLLGMNHSKHGCALCVYIRLGAKQQIFTTHFEFFSITFSEILSYFSNKINQLKIINLKRVGLTFIKNNIPISKMVPNIDKYWLLARPWTKFIHGHVWSLVDQIQTRKSRTDVWTLNYLWSFFQSLKHLKVFLIGIDFPFQKVYTFCKSY